MSFVCVLWPRQYLLPAWLGSQKYLVAAPHLLLHRCCCHPAVPDRTPPSPPRTLPGAVCDCRVFVLLNEAPIYNAPLSSCGRVTAACLSAVTCATPSPALLLHIQTEELRVKGAPTALRHPSWSWFRFIEIVEGHLQPFRAEEEADVKCSSKEGRRLGMRRQLLVCWVSQQ